MIELQIEFSRIGLGRDVPTIASQAIELHVDVHRYSFAVPCMHFF